MHRRLTIRSDPPGALVRLEGEDIGYTPVSIDYTYYGTREITLLKDGYETRTVMQPISAPWYQVLPFEFVSDNLALTNRNEWCRRRKCWTGPTDSAPKRRFRNAFRR